MESDPEQENLNPEEALVQKHRKERKELQSKIQALKKTATKGDKKKKKEVQEEIVKLELDLSKKQEAELESLKSTTNAKHEENKLIEDLENVEITNTKQPRITKAQKRRDKKAAEQKERERLIQEQEIENETGVRNAEIQKIKEVLKELGLMLYEIEADGNCLYNAVDHQLKIKTNFGFGTKQLRLETSNHMRHNSSDYLPFLSNVNTGEMLTDEEFDKYCFNVANTTNWGGQIELRALSHVIKRPITVIQADSPPLIMGEEYSDKDSLIIAYHRYMYGLGEHYNSVQPYIEDTATANF